MAWYVRDVTLLLCQRHQHGHYLLASSLEILMLILMLGCNSRIPRLSFYDTSMVTNIYEKNVLNYLHKDGQKKKLDFSVKKGFKGITRDGYPGVVSSKNPRYFCKKPILKRCLLKLHVISFDYLVGTTISINSLGHFHIRSVYI